MPTKRRGRPRIFDHKKQQQVIHLVARGAKLGDAAAAVGVSIRTIQRECRLFPDYNEELRHAQAATADPRELMHAAARTHWRAAAWLLERENPEHYGRRKASSCSPHQFDRALRTVMEAALRFAPPEARRALYEYLEPACQQAFKTVFPLYGPCGHRLDPELPKTPLADAMQIEHICDPRNAIPDYDDETGERLTPEVLARRAALNKNAACPRLSSPAGISGQLTAPSSRPPSTEDMPPPAHVDESLRDSKSISEKSTHANPRAPGARPAASSVELTPRLAGPRAAPRLFQILLVLLLLILIVLLILIPTPQPTASFRRQKRTPRQNAPTTISTAPTHPTAHRPSETGPRQRHQRRKPPALSKLKKVKKLKNAANLRPHSKGLAG